MSLLLSNIVSTLNVKDLQYLSGLLRARFMKTFLEIAVHFCPGSGLGSISFFYYFVFSFG